MSQTRTAAPIGHLDISESPSGNLARLAELARQAYEQKRTKDCLDLTRAILLIDPDNADAHWMRSSIQSEMHQDLENARAFLRQAQSKENAETPSEPDPVPSPAGLQADSVIQDLEPARPETDALPLAPDDLQPALSARWLAYAGVLIVVGGLLGSWSWYVTKSNSAEAREPASSASDRSKEAANRNGPQPLDPLLLTRPADVLPVSVPPPATPPTPAPTVRPAFTDRSATTVTPDPPPVTALPDEPLSLTPSGTLAVSSPATVDIYKDDLYIGSTPVSVAMSAGVHMIEYRHGSLRKTMTHVINSNETTRATITFDVVVQINSKPWANVFLDGVERKALGQTPLSGVRIPIGSVLILENPQFPSKRHRVTGSERIQIVFP